VERVEDVQEVRRKLGSRITFEREYSHLWLVRALTDDEMPAASFHTQFSGNEASPSISMGIPATTTALASLLRVDPERYGFHRIIKSGANPWSDRIIVGRAPNNDIVLRHESVSKVHAYFENGKVVEGEWRVRDAKSRNGTRLDGAAVSSDEEGVPVQSGSLITFGSVACLILSSGDVFDLF
jgi:hypothetical protein